CTVLLDGRSVKSCTVLAVQAQGHAITTIEGLAGPDRLHPVQEAFRRCHGLQCGFCTPGMVMAAVSLIDEGRARDERSVRSALEGNLCRCTGYHNIVQAVLAAARTMRDTGSCSRLPSPTTGPSPWGGPSSCSASTATRPSCWREAI